MWSDFRKRFPIFDSSVYLNTCSLGALSRESQASVEHFLRLWQRMGASAWYELWLGEIERLRTSVARLLDCSPGQIALFPSVSAAVGAVASCFDYGERNRVLCADLDFPTVAYQWHARARDGVEVVLARSPDGLGVPESMWEDLLDERTAFLATGHVFFTTGWRQDPASLAERAHRHGALLLVDAYQSAGIFPLPVRSLGIDLLVGGGLKWLLGGPGVAFLYVRRELIETLDPRATGWFAVQEPFRFDGSARMLRDDARRLEGGTPSPASIYAARAGLDLVLETGVEGAGKRTMELVNRLIEQARGRGFEVRCPQEPERRSGIVILPDPDPGAAVNALAREGFIVDARPTGIRVSPYAYNTEDDLDHMLGVLEKIRPRS